MEPILLYILKVSGIQMALFAIFWLLNRNNTSFQFNRFFLVATLIVPFIIPFIEIPVHLGNYKIAHTLNTNEIPFDDYAVVFSELQPASVADKGINWLKVVAIGLYVGISVIFAVNMISGLWCIKKFRRQSRYSELTPRGYLLHLIPSDMLSFSFFREVFLSDQFKLNSNEKKAIIAHEEFHISQVHSVDIVLTELVRIVFWFNPVIYLIQKYLKQNHEFHTDLYIKSKYELIPYKDLLRSHQWKEFNLLLGNSISGSSINKRIKMMEKSNQTPARTRSIITAISALLLFFAFACQESLEPLQNADQEFQFEFTNEDLESEIQRELETSLKNAPEDYIQSYINEQRAHPEYLYIPNIRAVPEREMHFLEKEKRNRIVNIPGGQLEYLSVFERELTVGEIDQYYKDKNVIMPEKVTVHAFIQKVDRYLLEEYNYKMNRADEEIHDDYDTPATIGNGDSDLSKFIKERLVYPEIAKVKGIEDKVVMKFVVTKLGGIVYLNFDKFPEIEDEDISLQFQIAAFKALRATEGKWKPAEKNGRYVLSWRTVPIEFKLED